MKNTDKIALAYVLDEMAAGQKSIDALHQSLNNRENEARKILTENFVNTKVLSPDQHRVFYFDTGLYVFKVIFRGPYISSIYKIGNSHELKNVVNLVEPQKKQNEP